MPGIPAHRLSQITNRFLVAPTGSGEHRARVIMLTYGRGREDNKERAQRETKKYQCGFKPSTGKAADCITKDEERARAKTIPTEPKKGPGCIQSSPGAVKNKSF